MASHTNLFFTPIATSNVCFTVAYFTVNSKYFHKFKVNKSHLFTLIFFFLSIVIIKHFYAIISKHHLKIFSTSAIAQTVNSLACCFWKLSWSFNLNLNNLFCLFPFLSPRSTACTHHSISRFHRRQTTIYIYISTTTLSNTTTSFSQTERHSYL